MSLYERMVLIAARVELEAEINDEVSKIICTHEHVEELGKLCGFEEHKHRCENPECDDSGMTWSHARDALMDATDEEHTDAHRCPSCGMTQFFVDRSTPPTSLFDQIAAAWNALGI